MLLQVLLGLGFRVYDQVTSLFNIQTKVCYTVNRGYNQPPVQSCEGDVFKLLLHSEHLQCKQCSLTIEELRGKTA